MAPFRTTLSSLTVTVLLGVGARVAVHAQGTFVFANRVALDSPPIRLCDAADPIQPGHTVQVRVLNPVSGGYQDVVRNGQPFSGVHPTNGFFNAGTLTVPFLVPGEPASLEIEIRDPGWFPGAPSGIPYRITLPRLGGGILPAARLPALPGRWSYSAGYRIQFPSGAQVVEGGELPVVLEVAPPYREFEAVQVPEVPSPSPGLPEPREGIAPGRVYVVGFPPVLVTNLVHGTWKGTLTNLTYVSRPGAYGEDWVVTSLAGGGCTLANLWTPNRITILPDPRRPFLLWSSEPASGRAGLRLRGLEGRSHLVESSTDLTAWTPVATVVGSTGEMEVPGTGPAEADARFYRLAR